MEWGLEKGKGICGKEEQGMDGNRLRQREVFIFKGGWKEFLFLIIYLVILNIFRSRRVRKILILKDVLGLKIVQIISKILFIVI